MIGIRLEAINKSYDGDRIIENLDLSIEAGKFFALLGPSGCGKTTLLRLITGFETADSGKIYLGGNDITHLPVHRRNINTVFQNYALFPHLNVFENVAYGLRIKKFPYDLIKQKVNKVLTAVRLQEFASKSIHQLSGGQQQRIALARAIVNEPDVLLLDEPLAALDVKLREQMLLELMDLQENFRTTFVYVTHDQTEALTVADQMAIMNHRGEIEQVGDPKDIYEFPNSSFVAQFVGATNLLKGTVQLDGAPILKVGGLGDVVMQLPKRSDWIVSGTPALLSLRPEKIAIFKKPQDGFDNQVSGIVETIVYQGRSTQYKVRIGQQITLTVFEQNEEHFTKAQEEIDYYDTVYLHWQKGNAVLLQR